MTRLFDHCLEFLAGVEGDNAAGADGNLLAGLGVAARPLRLVAQLEVAEARELYAFAALERAADLLEEGLDHVLGLALVQPDLLEQEVGQLGLRQRHHTGSLKSLLCTERCREFAPQQSDQLIAGSVCFRIRKGSFSILHNYPERKAFPVKRHPGATEKAKERHGACNGRLSGSDYVENILNRDLEREEHGDVAEHGRLVRR